MQWKIEFYSGSSGSSPVADWLLEQEPKVQAKFAWIFDLLQEHGILVGMPHIRPITNSKLFEIRVEQQTNIYRIFYVAYRDKRLILLHGFQKKTQKTPRKELEIAEKRIKDFLGLEQSSKG
ncbi:MAG: type II toxin-antitoxin system RelE/ParE family toxin [Planktothrix sp.]